MALRIIETKSGRVVEVDGMVDSRYLRIFEVFDLARQIMSGNRQTIIVGFDGGARIMDLENRKIVIGRFTLEQI